jgi:signal transduction histidine kinase
LFFLGCENRNSRIEKSQSEVRLFRDSSKNRLADNKKLLKILLEAKQDSLNNRKIFEIAWDFYQMNQWRYLKESSDHLLKRARQSNDSTHIALSHLCLGYYYTNLSFNDSALYNFVKAKKIFLKIKQKKYLPQCFLDIGRVQYFNSDYVGSEATFLKALKYAKAYKNHEVEYICLFFIANISNNVGEYETAYNYANKALFVVEHFIGKKYDCIELCLNSIGYNLYKSGRYQQSIKFYERALKQINSCSENPELYSLVLDNIANSKMKLQDFRDVPALYYQSAKIRDSFNIYQGRNYNKLYLSEYYLSIQDTVKAVSLAKEALVLSKSFKAPNDVLDCLKHLSLIDKNKIGYYAKNFIQLSDSLQLAERKSRNKFARIAFETDELTEEKDQAVLQKWIVLAISVVIFILGILLFIIKMQRAKQKELLFIQEQQKSDEAIYQLIHDQQIKIGEGRQSEKKRISIELHDGVMNRLASTRLNLFILNKKRDDETIEKCLTFIDDIQGIEKEIRQVAHDLSNDLFSGNTSFNLLLKALFAERKSISKFSLQTQIDHHINWEIIDNILKMNLYRILQEALQNCHKYAHAKNVFVTISKEEDILYVSIHDDGNGFDLKKVRKGIGLKNIGQRVDLLKGKLKIHARVGEGTMINITIPVSK